MKFWDYEKICRAPCSSLILVLGLLLVQNFSAPQSLAEPPVVHQLISSRYVWQWTIDDHVRELIFSQKPFPVRFSALC